MCIVAVAWQCFTQTSGSKNSNLPNIPLVLIGNRDEFFQRPTLPLHHWEDAPILAGRDSKSGGTWLGINPDNGKWATVLNVREIGHPEPEHKISRGKLVSDYLAGDMSPRDFAKRIELACYEGFNLLLGDLEQAFIISNRGQALQNLPAGLHVFSNGQMTGQESHWAKSEKLRGRVRQEVLPLVQEQQTRQTGQELANASDEADTENVLEDWQTAALDCLRDNTKADWDNLPDTGLPAAFEQPLSSVFIEPLDFQDGYGTRVSSVLALSTRTHARGEHTCQYDFVNQAYTAEGSTTLDRQQG